MKIAIYAICKNEKKFVQRWLESCKDADYICVLDTGSTDDTLREISRWVAGPTLKRKVTVYKECEKFAQWDTLEEYDTTHERSKLYPWRFDMARNHSMDMIPDDTDVCICLDLDEILCPGWREDIERHYRPEITTYRYEYVWNFRDDGTDGVKFMGEKIHKHGCCVWDGVVHETLKYHRDRVDEILPCLRIEHHADDNKSRANYLPMLELSVREDEMNDRNMHYLGREYYFRGQYEKAIETLYRHLSLPTARWDEERAASQRYIALSYEALGNKDGAKAWYGLAHETAPKQREPLICAAKLYLAEGNWKKTIELCEKALTLKDRPMTYMSEAYAWGEGPWDLMSVALWYEGKYQSAVECCRKAIAINPADKRLRNNLALMTGVTK